MHILDVVVFTTLTTTTVTTPLLLAGTLPLSTPDVIVHSLVQLFLDSPVEVSLTIVSSLYFFPILFSAVLLWVLYVNLQAPLNITRTPTVPRKTRDQKAAEFPPPFPNGWFNVCLSQNLVKGQVKELDLFGQKLVLFRSKKSGEASVLDGYCPHLGANLGVCGTVVKDCLKCCFHGWEFDVKGQCVKVDGTDVIPPGSSLRKWPVEEKNGVIYVWHHADGEEPSWRVDPIPEIECGYFYCSGKTWCHVNAHVQELPENGPDRAHLNVLHKPFVWERIANVMTHLWTAEWKPHETLSWKSDIRLTQVFRLFGVTIPGTQVVAEINQIGPGMVLLHLSTPLGRLYAFEYVTPSKTTTQVVEHTMYCAPTIPRFMGKWFLWALEAQFQRDTPIWETKKFLKKPVVSKADGPIMAFRRWYSQFYSSGSVTFAEALARESMMDW